MNDDGGSGNKVLPDTYCVSVVVDGVNRQRAKNNPIMDAVTVTKTILFLLTPISLSVLIKNSKFQDFISAVAMPRLLPTPTQLINILND